MEDKQILSLILDKLTSMESDIKEIKTVQSQHTEQIQIIKEQTARNAELESKHDELVKEVKLLKVDVQVIKRAITNN